MAFFGLFTSSPPHSVALFLHNTLTGEKEEFHSLKQKRVGMYNCGPTVYDSQHIGNLRPFIFADTLKRTLAYNGYTVTQVINITDVGHLTSDADVGEDKVEAAASSKGETTKELTERITSQFIDDLEKVGIATRTILFPRATEHIDEQIAFIKTLEEKGYTYHTSDGIYFDTARFPGYGKLGNINLDGLQEGARIGAHPEKRNPTDFALWKFSPKEPKRQQEWDSPWGVGFPGWHLECSAMSMKYLGKQFDIHTGGIDHIPIHHNNEIAQSEAVTKKQFVRYWMHSAFITIEGTKISKSLGNTILLRNLEDRGYSPLSYRYWILSAHYNSPMNFTWEALDGAQTALLRLHKHFVEELGTKNGAVAGKYQEQFYQSINDDLDTPRALALLHQLVKDPEISAKDKRATILEFDRVLGLGFIEGDKRLRGMLTIPVKSIGQLPSDVQELITAREKARKNKNWAEADALRTKIKEKGYEVNDTPEGPQVTQT